MNLKKIIQHPTLPVTLTFDRKWHTYIDDEGTKYDSVSKRVKNQFPVFDARATAARIAARENRTVSDILAEWKAKGAAASTHGDLVHAYAESVLTMTPVPDIPPELPPKSRQDALCAFRMVDAAVGMLRASYAFLGVEQVVFDPLYAVAGSADMVARNKSTGALAIFDWKTCENITNDDYGQVALPPIAHIRNSKVSHYALQLSFFAWMLTDLDYSAYPSRGEPVELALIHLPHVGKDPVWRPVPYLGKEVSAICKANL